LRLSRAALLAFFLSRALFFAIVIAGSQTAFVQKVYSNSAWETRIELSAQRFWPELQRMVLIGDGWWYRSVATRGYDERPFDPSVEANWAFFPLYPLVVRIFRITGEFAADGLIVSNLALLGALLLLGRVATLAGVTADDAARATFYAAFFPTSYFFSLPQTESLFLLLTLAAFYFALRERWWAAGLFGGLAALTRVTGILLLPALLALAFERRSKARAALLWLALIPAGLGLFMLHLQRLTGNAFAFAGIQARWGRAASLFWRPIVDYFACPWCISAPWNLKVLNLAAALLLLAAGVTFLVQRRWSFAVLTLGTVLLALSAGSLQSIARYVLTVFPLFLWLAARGRGVAADWIITAISMTLFGCMVALFALRLDFALT
jgi:hypothetical protein